MHRQDGPVQGEEQQRHKVVRQRTGTVSCECRHALPPAAGRGRLAQRSPPIRELHLHSNLQVVATKKIASQLSGRACAEPDRKGNGPYSIQQNIQAASLFLERYMEKAKLSVDIP